MCDYVYRTIGKIGGRVLLRSAHPAQTKGRLVVGIGPSEPEPQDRTITCNC